MSVQNQVGFVDFGRDFLRGNTVNPDLFLGDGLHPNAAGYRVLGENLNKLLNGSLK